MPVWFEGKSEIDCNLQQVQGAFDSYGEHYLDVIRLMPGLTTVELLEQGPNSVTIKTNEGLMTRTNITKRIDAESVVVEFDEVYEAGSKITVTSHFTDEFTTSGTGVMYRTVISDVAAPGFLGFFYLRFGGSKMGNAFLKAYTTYFERPID